MAYRRKNGAGCRPSSTYSLDELCHRSSPSSLAAEAFPGEQQRASHGSNIPRPASPEDLNAFAHTPPKYGFWSVLAQKAKAILEDDDGDTAQMLDNSSQASSGGDHQYHQPHQSPDRGMQWKSGKSPAMQKRLDALATSLNYIGGKVGNALEEGLSIVENRTADILQETRKLNIRRKASNSNYLQECTNAAPNSSICSQAAQADQAAAQLKKSRDVANAMAAKAKLLMRELKTVKADLAFAKERTAQLEEENKILRENRDKGEHPEPEDDDMIRLQLESLLAEKARLAHENSVYARENRFLREIVEYHQLTMQDVIYLDEGIGEVAEVCPVNYYYRRDAALLPHQELLHPPPALPQASQLLSQTSSTPKPTAAATRPALPDQEQTQVTPSPRALAPQVSITAGAFNMFVESNASYSPPRVFERQASGRHSSEARKEEH